MYGLDNQSGVNAMPALAPVKSPTPLWFTEGGSGLAPSYPGQDWFNQVQAELLNILKAADIAPQKDNFSQLSSAISKLASAYALSVVQVTGSSLTSVMSQKAVSDAVDKCLAKNQNGADIPDKATFISNLGLRSAAERDVGIGTNQIPDMSNFTASLSGIGWQKLPSGLIIQWGSYTTTGKGSKEITFPIAFPLACISLSVTRHQPGTNGAINASSLTAYSFAVQDYAAGDEVFSMMALGY